MYIYYTCIYAHTLPCSLLTNNPDFFPPVFCILRFLFTFFFILSVRLFYFLNRELVLGIHNHASMQSPCKLVSLQLEQNSLFLANFKCQLQRLKMGNLLLEILLHKKVFKMVLLQALRTKKKEQLKLLHHSNKNNIVLLPEAVEAKVEEDHSFLGRLGFI